MSGNAEGTDPRSAPFLDDDISERFAWLTPRRVALFLIFWVTMFFAGSVFVNNPFIGGPGNPTWEIGAAYSSYYWVVMYLHGLNTCLVGLAALLAVDLLEISSPHVRKGILVGVLIAGILSPIGAIFNTSAPWNAGAGLWIQVTGFLALDEVVILLLWGMVGVWREGKPMSQTLPFLTVGLVGLTMLFAAVIGHLAGIILGFGNNPSIIGWYATQQLGETIDDFAFDLIGAHAYLMMSAVPVGVVSLVAIRFGYYRLQGWVKNVARVGFVMMGLDLVLQSGMALMSGFETFPGDLPPFVASMPWVPSFLALNDLINFLFLILGGILVLFTIAIGNERVRGWKLPAGLPLRIFPLLMFVMFTVVTTITEPSATSATSVGTPAQAWIRLFIGFFLTMLAVLVIVGAERLFGFAQLVRVGWTSLAGAALVFTGVGIYIQEGAYFGGYLAVVGIVLVGLSWFLTGQYGLIVHPRPAQQ